MSDITQFCTTLFILLHHHTAHLTLSPCRHGLIIPGFTPDVGRKSASRFGRFSAEKIASGSQLEGGWVGTIADLAAVEKGNILALLRI
jgi:hypothetical protein